MPYVLAFDYDLPHIEVHFDGCCEPKNPGGNAGWGATVDVAALNIKTDLSGFVGAGDGMSNNVAEYSAILGALQYILSHQDVLAGLPIHIMGDSALVACQQAESLDKPNLRCACYSSGCGKKARNGNRGCWPQLGPKPTGCVCKVAPPAWSRSGSGLYETYATDVKKILLHLPHIWSIDWVSRDFNGRADELSKRVLLDRGVEFKIQPIKKGE